MIFQSKYDLFGASVSDVLAYLPSAGWADVATVRRTIAQGSTTTTLVVDSSVGFEAGGLVHVPVAGHEEVRMTGQILSATSFSLTQALSAAPAVGDVVDDGPEVVWRELVRAESFVLSKLPERYRRLIDRVDGELIVRSAEQGQQTAQLALPPAGTVKLCKNYSGLLEDLAPDDELDPAAWSCEDQTITFAPTLEQGDRVLASYDAAPATICILQTLLVDLATWRLGRKLFGQLSSVTPEWLLSFHDRGEKVLDEIFTTGRGIAELDAIVLFEDWQRPTHGIAWGVVERS